MAETSFTCALLSGASAGAFVDIALFPIDTLKTRLQSSQGFFKGGFKGIYSGLSAAALGSAPGASLFFSTYETMKAPAKRLTKSDVLSQQLAAGVGECVACLVRVPTEVVKQNMQAGNYGSMSETTSSLLKAGRPVSAWQGAVCGALSGGFSGALTTPLDLAKTRLMLGADANGKPYKGVVDVWCRVYQEMTAVCRGGIRGLYAGAGPRTFWLTLGGVFFFGAYEKSREMLKIIGV